MCKEDKCKIVKSLQNKVSQLETKVEKSDAKIKELEAELEKYKKPPKDSSNSSIPPSKDPYRKPYPKREKSDKKPGAQPGHKGTTKMLSDNPDKIIELYPPKCTCCGNNGFIKIDKVLERRQETEIPPIVSVTTEFQLFAGICTRCGQISRGVFPERLKSPVVFGERIGAIISYLKVVDILSFEKVANTLTDVFGVSIAVGSTHNKFVEVGEILEPTYEQIGENLKSGSIIKSDETEAKINGKKAHTWIFLNDFYCLFATRFSRGFEVVKELIGESFKGTWVSDRYSGQLKIAAKHQLCLVHLVRNCKYPIQAEKSKWAEKLKTFLQDIMDFRKKQGASYNPLEVDNFRKIEEYKRKWDEIFEKPPPKEEELKLYNGLRGRKDQVLLFLSDSKIPYENNASERGVRNRVIHRKITGGFRNSKGAYIYDIVSSVVETFKMQEKNVIEELTTLIGKNQPLLSM